MQTESDIMNEFKEADIEVANRMFKTDDEEPTDNIEDLFVSLSLCSKFQLTGFSVISFPVNKAK